MFRNSVLIVVVVCGVSRVAAAQVTNAIPGGNVSDVTTATFDAATAVEPISIVEGDGVKVGEGTVLHPAFGMETGYISNVFYNGSPTGAALLRVMAQLSVASLSPDRLDPSQDRLDPNMVDDTPMNPEAVSVGSFQYRANLSLSYDQMLSNDSTVNKTGGLGVGALFRGMANPQGTLSLGVFEDYTRFIRAANFETSDNTNRDINALNVLGYLHPPGRSVSGYLYYNNTIDVFESSDAQPYPDRVMNQVGIHPMWKVFPRTSLYADASIGYDTGIGSSPASQAKPTSYPLMLRAGVSTLLSLKLTANVSGGYTNGFYSAGPSYSAPFVDAYLEYRYSPLGKMGIWYSLAYLDSVNANYYRDHAIRGYLEQLVDPFALLIQTELHFREYQGTSIMDVNGGNVRDDTIFAVMAGAHYNFRNWLAVTLDYRLSTVQTDYRYLTQGMPVDPSYVRHELLAGLRIAM